MRHFLPDIGGNGFRRAVSISDENILFEFKQLKGFHVFVPDVAEVFGGLRRGFGGLRRGEGV